MRYRLQRGTVSVTARGTARGTTVRCAKIDGTIDFDADAPSSTRAELSVDMRSIDAGDRFKNWKLESELHAEQHPTATFTLARFEAIHEVTSGQWTGTAIGQLRWRGHKPMLKIKGKATVDRRNIEAQATFDLDVRELGMQPRALVGVQVSIFAIGDAIGTDLDR
jgi:polyisoprenoid-binding protein YceI